MKITRCDRKMARVIWELQAFSGKIPKKKISDEKNYSSGYSGEEI